MGTDNDTGTEVFEIQSTGTEYDGLNLSNIVRKRVRHADSSKFGYGKKIRVQQDTVRKSLISRTFLLF